VAPHLARESFGIVLLEAMASQTAVVASDLAAFTDLLTPRASGAHRSLGLTFPAGDPAGLAAAVQHTLAHPDTERVQAAAQASRCYDWSVVGDAVAEVYRAVTSRRAGETSRVSRAPASVS
jgi:phosphatidylinositol alpha-mannosyltransferase